VHVRRLTAIVGAFLLSVAGVVALVSPSASASKHKAPKHHASPGALLSHPCTVVSTGQIAGALGAAPETPAKVSSGGECDYSSSSSFNFINIGIQENTVKRFFRQDSVGAAATQEVKGLGNDAFVTPATFISSNGAGSIFVLVGTTTLRIDVYLPVPPSTLEALAKDCLGKL
jgi:hypothetical protein